MKFRIMEQRGKYRIEITKLKKRDAPSRLFSNYAFSESIGYIDENDFIFVREDKVTRNFKQSFFRNTLELETVKRYEKVIYPQYEEETKTLINPEWDNRVTITLGVKGGEIEEDSFVPKYLEFDSYEEAENYIWEEYGNQGWKAIEKPKWRQV